MIIDFHTHTFPEKIAEKALKNLSNTSRAIPYTDGTVSDRLNSMKKAGIDISINLAVATKASQVEGINDIAIASTSNGISEGIIEFGSMHIEYENVKDELKRLSDNGVKGIKIHPAFYQKDIIDSRIKNIIYEAQALNLIVITHAGWDIGFPEANYIPVKSLLEIDKEISPKKMVLAHMGGWNDWKTVESDLAGSDYYFDTSFSIGKINARLDPPAPMRSYNMQDEDFLRLCKKHGINKILFGTDSPWSDQKEYVDKINTMSFSEEEKEKIYHQNAEKLLGI
ncbi:MAG: amidohydrolase family protein [Lachnospiraceae bacterium]|nr:amidohydrolase family protein [Lachnospiraceae bacterium]